MIESFAGAGATRIFAAIREHDDRAAFLPSLGQIVGRPQDCVIE